MCGEILPNQKAEQATVRLTTSADNVSIRLPKQFQRVEEIRLDELFFSNFKGGASGIAYLNLKVNGCAPSAINNENEPGTAIAVDVLNPHILYSRPRVLQTANGVTINDFQIRIENPDGTATTFAECLLVLTFVMRKSAAEVREYREQQALMEIPQMKGPLARSTYANGKI